MLSSSSVTALLLGFFGLRRQNIGCNPTPYRLPIGAMPATGPVRRVSPKQRRHGQGEAIVDVAPTPYRLPPDALPVMSSPRICELPPRELARRHARFLLATFLGEVPPGSVLSSGDMYLLYAEVCEKRGVYERPWNSVACVINGILGKSYHRMHGPGGREKQTRVYIAPDLHHPRRSALERFLSEDDQRKKRPRINRLSTPKRLRRGTASTPMRAAA
jgi:hypothetical protein